MINPTIKVLEKIIISIGEINKKLSKIETALRELQKKEVK